MGGICIVKMLSDFKYLQAEQSLYSNPTIKGHKITTKLTLIHYVTNIHTYKKFDRSIFWPHVTHFIALGGHWKSYFNLGSQWTHYHTHSESWFANQLYIYIYFSLGWTYFLNTYDLSKSNNGGKELLTLRPVQITSLIFKLSFLASMY